MSKYTAIGTRVSKPLKQNHDNIIFDSVWIGSCVLVTTGKVLKQPRIPQLSAT